MGDNIIVQIAVIGAFGLIGLGILAMIVSGIKGLTQGKQDVKRIGLMAVPFVIFGITYAILKDVAMAGVMTTMIMMGIMVVSIALTGIRGTFNI